MYIIILHRYKNVAHVYDIQGAEFASTYSITKLGIEYRIYNIYNIQIGYLSQMNIFFAIS